MAIIIVLAFGVVFILDPFELIDRTRDSQRVQDLRSLEAVIKIARQEGGGNFDPDGTETNSCVGESAQKVFVSIPLGFDMPSDLPSGWSYKRVTAANLFNTDGTGWLPIDLSGATGVGAQLSHLPIDPTNTFPSEYYYSYVCDRTGFNFELTTRLASKKHRTGGVDDAQTDDGGDDIFVYETGTDLSLDPKAPMAYWPLDGVTPGIIVNGTTVGFEDAVGTNHGTAGNSNAAGMQWATGVLGGAVDFDGVDDYITISDSSSLDLQDFTVSIWAQNGDSAIGWNRLISKKDIWSSSDGWEITLVSGSDTNLYLSGSSGVNLQTGCVSDWQDGQWHQVVAIYSGATVSLYCDGTHKADGAIAAVAAGTFPLVIGDDANYNEAQWDGLLDEIAIYDRPLTQVEIDYRYESLKP